MRVNSIAKSWYRGSSPRATVRRTSGSAKRNATTATTAKPSTISVRTLEASRQALRSCPCPRNPAKTGTKAEPNAPLITIRKIRSGILNAATNALISSLVPKVAARIVVRASPSARLITNASPMIAAEEARLRVNRAEAGRTTGAVVSVIGSWRGSRCVCIRRSV